MERVHLVLVPGFAGFDALGQLEYYAGVTPLFQEWRDPDRSGRLPVLHYFDNFPTAGVSTRAVRLREYLAKRVARGEFAAGDEVVLVGHSTGGLDIRRLLRDLAGAAQAENAVDGDRDRAVRVPARDLRRLISRVVFLSVPHWGTNIADWVRAHRAERWAVVNDLRAIVNGSQVPLLDAVEAALSGVTAHLADLDILLAMHDTLAESDPRMGERGPLRTAAAHESASHVQLWLRHMASDFSAIDDLACEAPDDDRRSPARFTLEERARELEAWSETDEGPAIRSRSYVTIAKRAYDFTAPEPRQWDFLQPGTWPDVAPTEASPHTDLTYRVCYRACAGGPFKSPALGDARVSYLDPAHEDLIGGWTQGTLAAWDNDGIVNTGSMVWRSGEDAVFVPADHMDIVGHYARRCAAAGNGREFQAYDLLVSACGFDEQTFRRVWEDVFAWAIATPAASLR